MSSPFHNAMPAQPAIRMTALLVSLLLLPACERETRRFRELPPTAAAEPLAGETPLQAGPPVRRARIRSAYEENAWGVAEGKRLFSQFNCVGCHARGGGAIGPPLMDEEWIYGSEPESIFGSIVHGRPNGMPAFGGRISTPQVWQLVAYVRSLSGWLRKDVAPAREDAMQVAPQEAATAEQQPRQARP